MRERLARALGDPTLEVVYRLADGRYVDATGRPVSLPDRADRAVTAVTAGGEEIAALVHDPALLDEPALVESVRATAGLVLENERLAAEVRSQLAEVRASRGRIVTATDAERRRIERDLHDGAQQRLVTLSVALGLEAARADPAAADVLSRAQDEVEAALVELRELARGIHPALLRDEGLEAAVEALARRAPLPVTVHGTVRGRLSDPIELAAYFVVSEALTNVVKHASATEASVLLEREPGGASGRGGGRRNRRRPRYARLGPGRAPRPTRGARRDARSLESEAGSRHDCSRLHPMRVVIADDAPLVREGIARLLIEHGVEVVDQVGDAEALLASVRDLAAGCRPGRHPDAADPHRRRAARGQRDPLALPRRRLSSSSRKTSSPSTRCDSSKRSPKESAT